MPNIELRHLRYFVAVAKELNLRRASQKLNIAQPALSRQMHDLERELGSDLFVRTSRGVELTPIGEQFLEEANGILNKTAYAFDFVRRLARGQVGRLQVAFVQAAMQLADVIQGYVEFRSLAPDIQVDLNVMSTAAQIEALASGKIDVGLLYRRTLPEGWQYADLCRHNYQVALPMDHPLLSKKELFLRDLNEESLLLPSRDMWPLAYDELVSICHAGGFFPKLVQEVQSEAAIANLTSAGLGVAFLNNTFAERHKVQGIVLREVADLKIDLILSLVWKESRATTPLAQFVTILTEATASHRH